MRVAVILRSSAAVLNLRHGRNTRILHEVSRTANEDVTSQQFWTMEPEFLGAVDSWRTGRLKPATLKAV